MEIVYLQNVSLSRGEILREILRQDFWGNIGGNSPQNGRVARSVVIACAVDPVMKEMDARLPTYVLLPSEDTGLDSEVVSSPASPFTLSKNALVERLSALPRKAQLRVDVAIRLVFGYEDWPA